MYELRCSLPRRTENVRTQFEARHLARAFLIEAASKCAPHPLANTQGFAQVSDGRTSTLGVFRLRTG